MTSRDPITVDDDLLLRWPLPHHGTDADKDARGHVLVVAGSREMPGAALLAATAALRAGAGKLVVATAGSVAAGVALALPEARVIALPESAEGGLRGEGRSRLERELGSVDAVLLGPGWIDESTSVALAAGIADHAGPQGSVVLDAMAMDVVLAGRQAHPRLLTPHAGEMAHLLQCSRVEVQADPQAIARQAAERWNCVVALKGSTTFIAAPDGRLWCHRCETPGLGTSGSGDTLAGVVTGLCARGAPLEQAAVWGVLLHARAGDALERRYGPLGYLARELPAEIPRLMHALAPRAG